MEYSEIGIWSEAKLDIVRKYAKAYSGTKNHGQCIKAEKHARG